MWCLTFLSAVAGAEPTETTFQDWKTLSLNGDPPLASTIALATMLPDGSVSNRNGAILMINCDKDGTVRIIVFEAALALTYPDATSTLRYDNGPWLMGANAKGDIPDAELANITSHGVMQIYWALPEGPLVASFSLAGSSAAINAATARCPAPTRPIAPAPAPAPTPIK